MREIGGQRSRLDALLAQRGEGQAADPFRKVVPRRVGQQRQMREARHGEAECGEELYLHRRIGDVVLAPDHMADRSEEHTSELQSLMRISYAVFCLKKKTKTIYTRTKSKT